MINLGSKKIEVYYEDTDAGGVVYYANYLKYTERGRTSILKNKGISQQKLAEEQGILFVVKSSKIIFHNPAILDDTLKVKTFLLEIKKSYFTMHQTIQVTQRKNQTPEEEILCCESKTIIACVQKPATPAGKIKISKIPEEVHKAISTPPETQNN